MVAGTGFVHRPLDGKGQVEGPGRLFAGDRRTVPLAPDAGQEGANAGTEGIAGPGGLGKVRVQVEPRGVAEGPGQEVDLELPGGIDDPHAAPTLRCHPRGVEDSGEAVIEGHFGADGIQAAAREAGLPITGFPAVAIQPQRRKGNLTDEFLTAIAREYLARGRGYAASLAREYFVTPRTVVSWVEKARARGLLSAAPGPGATGGHLLSAVSDDAREV